MSRDDAMDRAGILLGELEWRRDAEALTDSPNGPALERRVSRDGRLRAIRWIHPDIVMATVVVEKATVSAEMAFKLASAHAERRDEASFRSSLVREARSARRASCAMRNASSIVSASVINSGSSGLVTTKPPSSAAVRVRTSFPFETVYDLATPSILAGWGERLGRRAR